MQTDLDRAEATFDLVMRTAPTGMALLDLEGRLIAVNPALCHMLGRDEETLLTMTSLEVTHPEDVAADRAYGQRVLAGVDGNQPLIKRYLRPDGQVVWGQLSASVLRDAGGAPYRMVGQVVDITALKTAEDEVDQNLRLQRIAGNLARIGGWSIDLRDDTIRWSDELRALLDLPPDRQVVRDEILARYPDEDRVRVEEAVDACRHHGIPFDLELRLTTFMDRMLDIRLVGERDLERLRVVGVLQDITASKVTQAVTRQLANQLATTLEAISDAVFTVDRGWRFTYLNRRAEAMFSATRDELLGTIVWEAFPSIVGSDVDDAYRRAMTDNVVAHVESYFWALLETWVEQHVFPSDEGLTVFMSDIGAQVLREQRQERILQAERQASEQLRDLDRMKNAFLSAVSHELRTPLSIVQGSASTLQRLRGQLTDASRAELEDALVEQAGRLAKLLEDLLDVDRLTRANPQSLRERVDIVAVTRRAVATLAGAERVTIDAPPRLFSRGSEVQTERIVVNLVSNALKYAPDGEVIVRLRKRPGDRVLLEVHDEGPGIPTAELERIFEPFHRVDEHHPQPGTGIGLALVEQFARMQGGHAWAEAAETGAHLFVDLPAPTRSRKIGIPLLRRSASAKP